LCCPKDDERIGKIQCCSSGRKILGRKDRKSLGTLENKKILIEFSGIGGSSKKKKSFGGVSEKF